MPLFKRTGPDDDDETVSLSDDDHAWWASREHLERPFVPKHRTPAGAVDPPPSVTLGSEPSAFSERYSTESLFNWASSPEPDDPTHGGTGLPLDPYRVLGLQPGATLSEVIAAHRNLAKQYHPDQMHGADEDEQRRAAQTMSTVNAAYQELRSRLMGHPGAT